MQLYPIFIWWFIILIFGLVGWSLAFSLFRHLPDRGFALARPVGLLFTGYILWLGGTFRLLQNNVGGIVVALAVVLAVGLFWQRQQVRSGGISPLGWLRREWRYVLGVELLFSLAFIGWTIFKAYNPNIETAGGEKWMEITFINGVLRSHYFPPQDPWLSGFAISYYYFGYVLMAMATRLSGLVSTIAFTLYIPTLLAMTLTAALGILANLVSLYQAAPKSDSTPQPSNLPTLQPSNFQPSNPSTSLRTSLPTSNLPTFQPFDFAQDKPSNAPTLQLSAFATGLLAALFVAILGNLEGLLEVLHKAALLPAGFWTWLDIRDLKIPPAGPGDSWIPDRFIWWWRGSRVLTDYTLTGREQEVIDEFPFFSFLLGDVHPHVLALPFVLLVVALALNLISSRRSEIRGQRSVISSQKVELTSETEGVLTGEAAGVDYNLSAVGGLSAAVTLDKLSQLFHYSWSQLTTAMGGRLAFGLYALAVGSLFFLNAWDFPIYLSVLGLSFFAWLSRKDEGGRRKDENFCLPISSFILPALIGTAILAVAGVLLFLPFYATFQSQARGMLPNLWNPTRLPQFFVFFGPFLVAVTVLLLVLSRQQRVWRKYIGSTLLLTILGPVLIMLLALTGLLLSSAGRDYVQGIINDPGVQQVLGASTISALVQASLWRRLLNPWTFIFVGGLLGWAVALWVGRLEGGKVGRLVLSEVEGLEGWKVGSEEAKRRREAGEEASQIELTAGLPSPVSGHTIPVQFVLILILVGLALPLSVEFIYLRDNFGIRMNTIFKFYFQAWVLLALASAFAVYYGSLHSRGLARLAWQGGIALLVAGGLVYPVLATPNKADFFQNEPTLNAIAWIASYRPGDYAAIEWLRANASDQAVILEAPGAPAGEFGAYNYSGRISAMTGLPTLLGWGGHQSQWRGNYDEPGRREPDIDQLYNTTDLRQTQALLDKYGISYVIVGDFERERYAPPGLRKFEQLLEVAFQQDGTTIYQRR